MKPRSWILFTPMKRVSTRGPWTLKPIKLMTKISNRFQHRYTIRTFWEVYSWKLNKGWYPKIMMLIWLKGRSSVWTSCQKILKKIIKTVKDTLRIIISQEKETANLKSLVPHRFKILRFMKTSLTEKIGFLVIKKTKVRWELLRSSRLNGIVFIRNHSG